MYTYGTICFWAVMTQPVSKMLHELIHCVFNLYNYTVCLELLLKLIEISLLLSYLNYSLTQTPPKLQWFEKVNEVLVVLFVTMCTRYVR